MACGFYYWEESGRHGTLALQPIRNHCTKYNAKEPANWVGAEAIIEDWISYCPRVVELTDQPANTKETCLIHKKEHETEIAGMNGLDSQGVVLQGKSADTLEHDLGAVVSLAVSFKKTPW